MTAGSSAKPLQHAAGNIHSNHTYGGYGYVARVCLVLAINLGLGIISLLLQCYLFAAVTAHHEAAELAPGARPEDHDARHAAAH